MRTVKIVLAAVFLFCFAAVSFAAPVEFITQSDVDQKWSQINASNPGIIYGNFTVISTRNPMPSNSSIYSSDSRYARILTMSGVNRFFAMVNAANTVLTLDNIMLMKGSYAGDDTQGGGAIYAPGNGFTLRGNVSFEMNTSSSHGGAVYAASGAAKFTDKVTFKSNTATVLAGSRGGALYSGGDINFTSTSYLIAQSNEVSGNGGALYAVGNVIIENKAEINSNSAKMSVLLGSGGGIFAQGYITFTSTQSTVVISQNLAEVKGGGLYSGSSVTFYGGALIENNSARVDNSTVTMHYGGGIFAQGDVSFNSSSALTEIKNNVARDLGGGIFSSGAVTFASETRLESNSATRFAGGAVWALDDISFTSSTANLVMASNAAKTDGGALYSQSGEVNIKSYVKATLNSAGGSGGAVYSSGFVLDDGGEFSYNTASSSGGAVYINGAASSISAKTRDVLFSNNTASDSRNDIFVDASSVSAALSFNADHARSITLDGGIKFALDASEANAFTASKTGRGELILNGDNYLDIFNVSAGTVTFGADSLFAASNVSVSGRSFIDMRNNNNNDELKISDALNTGSAATLYFDINSDLNTSDIIIASASASMNGTTVMLGVGGVDAGTKTYRIIETAANQGSGQLAVNLANSDLYANFGKNLSDPSEIIVSTYMTRVHASLLYDGHGYGGNWTYVDLVVQIDQLNALAGLTDNQLQNALALDRDYGNAKGDLFYIIDQIDRMGTVKEKKNALNDLSGHFYANMITVPALNTSKNNVFSRLKKSYFLSDDSDTKRNIWAQGYLSSNKYKGDINSPGDFEASNNGILAGFDTLKDEKHIFGLAAGYVDTYAEQNDDSADIDGYSIGGYGAYFFENNFEIKAFAAGARQNYDTKRKIRYLGRTTKADFEGYSLNLSAEVAYNHYYKGNIYFRPFAGMDYSYTSTREFTEKGADSADLTIYSGTYNRANANLGFQLNNGADVKLKWYGELKFDLLCAGRYGKFEGEYKNTENSLEIIGIENDVFNTVLGAGVLYDISQSFSAYVNVNASFSGSQTGYYGNIGLNYKFATHHIDFYDR